MRVKQPGRETQAQAVTRVRLNQPQGVKVVLEAQGQQEMTPPRALETHRTQIPVEIPQMAHE